MKVVLGITGCIGAYKSALVLRLLQKEGFEIVPVMTESATRFITPLTLEKLSGNRAVTHLFQQASAEIEHITLARESSLLLVAPATANILAKFARGIADDFLSTLYLSTTTPVIIAPAMNVEMWRHPATQANLKLLRRRGVTIVEPGIGYQACGEYGEGRLADPEKILEAVKAVLRPNLSLEGLRVLVTAGPTVEDIDPVRYLSNRSSGKMGYEIAREAERRGADVYLVSGPAHLEAPPGVRFTGVRSASEMADVVLQLFENMDVVIKAAAVSDFKPIRASSQKLKKSDPSVPTLQLERNVDILRELGKRKREQLLIGFAAESENVEDHARRKLEEKSLDLIVANDISASDSGFQSNENQVIFLDHQGNSEKLPRLSKQEVSQRLWDKVEILWQHKKKSHSQQQSPATA